MSTELESLQLTLNAALDIIRDEIKVGGYPALSSLATEPHPLDLAGNLPTQKLYAAQTTAIAALGRLQLLIQNPYQRANSQVFGVYDAAVLDAAVKTGVIDVLSSAPDIRKGMDMADVQKRLDLDPKKLTIILRLLATTGWVHEVSEGVFALTRSGLQLRQGENAWKLIQTPGKPRVAAALKDMISHPQWKYSQSSTETAYQIAFDTSEVMFRHVYANPEVAATFANSIRSLGDEFSPGVLSDYPWKDLDGKTIVDCGGGQGSFTLLLVSMLPKSKFVVQDLAGPLEIAKLNFQKAYPRDLESGRINL